VISVVFLSFHVCAAFNDASEITKLFNPETQTGSFLRIGYDKPKYSEEFNDLLKKIKNESSDKEKHLLFEKLKSSSEYDTFYNSYETTEKHLNTYFEGIKKANNNDILHNPNFKITIKNIAKKENFFAPTHHCFYHAMHNDFSFIQDVIKVFLKVFQNKDLPDDLAVLRLPYKEFEKNKNVAELKNDYKKALLDSTPEIRKMSLAVGPTPFNYTTKESECPISYFINPRKHGGAGNLAGKLTVEELLKEVFDYFNIGQYFSDYGPKLLNMLTTPINSYSPSDNSYFLQIFIPKKLTNDYVWFSAPRGLYQTLTRNFRFHKKDGVECTNWGKCNEKDCTKGMETKSIAEFLDLYKTNTKEAEKFNKFNHLTQVCLDIVQFRIYLHPKKFLNPDSDIKVYKHSKQLIDEKMSQAYFAELEKFAKELKQAQETNKKIPTQKNEVKHTFDDLLANIKLYKTTNTSFHAGDLYQHSIWTACVIQQWFEENSFWCEGLTEQDKKLAMLTALLHDIGKAGDLYFNYFDKENHPEIGFKYLLGKKKYRIDYQNTFDFSQFFENLGISKNDQKTIAFLVSAHHEFGKIMKRHLTPEKASKKYRERLSNLAEDFSVDERLFKLAILISVADVKATQKPSDLIESISIFDHTIPCNNCDATHPGRDAYQMFEYETKGKELRRKILEPFKERKHKTNISSICTNPRI